MLLSWQQLSIIPPGQGETIYLQNKTPSQAQAIISKSWDSLAGFFPRLPFSKANLKSGFTQPTTARWMFSGRIR